VRNYLAEDARLLILFELSRQTDGRLDHETLLDVLVSGEGYSVTLEWVDTQLNFLEQVGAVALAKSGSLRTAEILRPGLDHVARRLTLAGVRRPGVGEGRR
jgi:hypothetical protein